jgi:glycosyltransferase involved in cell wall biosynthesis
VAYPSVSVVHIITRFINGGADENTLEACNWSARRGDQVHLLFGRRFDQSIVDKLDERVKVVKIADLVHPISPLLDFRAFLQIRKVLADLNPDVVHTHTSKAGILGRAAARSVGVAAIIHGIHIAPFQNVGFLKRHLYLALERLAARWTSAFISVSDGMMQAYLEQGIGNREDHSVIHSGMQLNNFRAALPENNADLPPFLKNYAGPKPKIVLMVAALERRKRHAELIESFDAVFSAVPEAILVLAGGGKEQAAVEQKVRLSRFKDRIFLLGHVEEPGKLIALTDVAVHCAEREGLPRVIVQYIAGGVPVVMTSLPGVGDLVTDGENGLIVGQDDFKGLANALSDVLASPQLLTTLRKGARSKDVSSWDLDVTGRKQHNVYEKVLGRLSAVNLESAVKVLQ